MTDKELPAFGTMLPHREPPVPLDRIVSWLEDVQSGSWRWTANGRCKYVTVKIDTRSGAYRIEDRDGAPITLAELAHQHGRPQS